MRGEVLPAVLGPPSEDELSAWRRDAKVIQQSPAVPEAFRGKPREIFAVWLQGRELGIPPMRSLHLFDVVDGRTAPRAECLVLLAARAGHKIEGDANAEQAVARGTRADNGAEMVVTVTMEEMRKVTQKGKPLTDKKVWQEYPADMLWARAVSRLVRRLCPDVLAGSLAVYAQTEAPQALSGEVIEAPALDLVDDGGDLHITPTPTVDAESGSVSDGTVAGGDTATDPALPES